MVNDDPASNRMCPFLLAGLLACGCVQTRAGDGLVKGSPAAGYKAVAEAATADGTVALAISKPARPGGSAPAQAITQVSGVRAEGPDLDPVRQAVVKPDAPGEQAPAPRPMPQGPPDPAAAPAKDSAAKTPGQPQPPSTNKDSPAPGTTAGPPKPAGARYAPELAPVPRKVPPAPPGAAVVPAAVPLVDPHQRPVPTAAGELLNLPPGASLAERALQLSSRLAAADADRQALELRARELSAALEARDQALARHGREIHEAAEEVARAREQVAGWRKELEAARARMRDREQDDVQTLKAVIGLLERLTEPGPEARHEGAPSREADE